MARTFRRRRERHEYYWMMHDWEFRAPYGHWVPLDPRSKAGRKAIARFHSDNAVTMGGSAPRWYRKVFDRRIRTGNDRMLRRWLADPEFDPVFRTDDTTGTGWPVGVRRTVD